MPRKRSRSVPYAHPITVMVDGKEYKGTYTLEGKGATGMTVTSAYGTVHTHVTAGMSAQEWAEATLRMQIGAVLRPH